VTAYICEHAECQAEGTEEMPAGERYCAQHAPDPLKRTIIVTVPTWTDHEIVIPEKCPECGAIFTPDHLRAVMNAYAAGSVLFEKDGTVSAFGDDEVEFEGPSDVLCAECGRSLLEGAQAPQYAAPAKADALRTLARVLDEGEQGDDADALRAIANRVYGPDECAECGSLGSQCCAPDCETQRQPDNECPHCGGPDLQDTPAGRHCISCGVNVDEYEPEIPANYPVQPLGHDDAAERRTTCGTCSLSWDDAKVTSMTPTPSGRCPFEAFHKTEVQS
jgi:hypothetical protein